MNIEQPSVIIDDEPLNLLEREDRPRSRTWPILPPPIETIHEHERDAEIAEPPPIIEEVEAEEEAAKAETNTRKNSRKNAWGNLSYADLITQAIQSSPEQRLTLSQIYEWMVRNIPYFKDKGDSTSSAGWKNSIRHNLSLHSRFMRVQNDNNGKSSYWVINPDAKPGKSSRRRSGSVDGQQKVDKKRRNKKMHQSTDDISALSPSALKLKHNRSYDNLFAASPCSSTDSLPNMEDFHANELSFPYSGDSFARPRSTSNVSTQSSINGRTSPPPHELDDMLGLDDNQVNLTLGVTDEIESMSIENHIANTINLNDSMKYGGSNENMIQTRRPHSDSFGSGDSGYESPALLSSPIQQMSNMQNRQMNKLPSPNLVPSKPPPPYNTGFHSQMRQQSQSLFSPNFYQQSVNQPSIRLNMMSGQQAPRLKHLPVGNQNAFPSQKPTINHFNHRLGNRTYLNTMQQNMYDGYMANNLGTVPNIAVQHDKMNRFQPQQQQQQQQPQQQQTGGFQVMNINDDIPFDLSQVPLFGFDDPQQLASDLDAIIQDEMKDTTSFKSLCEYDNDSNNNRNANAFNQQRLSVFPGQHWVR